MLSKIKLRYLAPLVVVGSLTAGCSGENDRISEYISEYRCLNYDVTRVDEEWLPKSIVLKGLAPEILFSETYKTITATNHEGLGDSYDSIIVSDRLGERVVRRPDNPSLDFYPHLPNADEPEAREIEGIVEYCRHSPNWRK